MTKGIISEIRNRKIFEKKVVNNWWTQLKNRRIIVLLIRKSERHCTIENVNWISRK